MVTKEIVKIFPAAHDTDLSCMQTDIAGFYNQVEHIRTIESIEFDVHCYMFSMDKMWIPCLSSTCISKRNATSFARTMA